MRHLHARLLAIAVVALGTWHCTGKVKTCKSSSDCSTAELCVAGTCRPSCLDGSTCPTDSFCLRGACMPVSMSCTAESDCPDGYTCSEGVCGQLCNQAADCPLPVESCELGVCTANPNPECTATSECHATGPCATDLGTRCLGGRCQLGRVAEGTPCDDENPCTPTTACDSRGRCIGASLPCEAPPPSSCNPTDDTFQSYVDVGVCNPATGGCDYAHLDFACPSCTAVCLARCAGLTCDETHGGCQYAGICVPDEVPRCQYDVAVDGTTCDLPGDLPGSLRGRCVAGTCDECLTPADCQSPPPGPAVCFVAECNLSHCDYATQAAAVCAAQSCANGTKTLARTCGADGSCPATGTASCGGYVCNNAGTDCLTTCSDAGDCISSYACDGGTCKSTVVLKPLGESCGNGAECQSTFCADSRCCDGDCAGACKACGTDGHCNVTPADDDACGTIDCDGLDLVCRDYQDLTAGRCKGFGQCKLPNSADCTSFTNSAAGAQPTGCNAAATGCSGADTCDGSGGCDTNDYPAGTEGNCGTCSDCNGAGTCEKVTNGQQDNGCTGGGGSCKDSDTCENGSCNNHHYNDGVKGGCGTCKVCNGGGSCRDIPNGNTDGGCDGTCQSCQGGGCSSQTQVTCWVDNDSDGYAPPGAAQQSFCTSCGDGFTITAPGSMFDGHTDCNDSRDDMHPGADWGTDTLDRNCDDTIERDPSWAYTSCSGSCDSGCNSSGGAPTCGDTVYTSCGGDCYPGDHCYRGGEMVVQCR